MTDLDGNQLYTNSFMTVGKYIDKFEFYSYGIQIDIGYMSLSTTTLFDSIDITTEPTKTSYTYGDNLDLSGMVVKAYYSDKTSKTITDYTVSGYDPTKVGKQTVTVHYLDMTDTFDVTVSAGELSSIEIASKPNKTQGTLENLNIYLVGDLKYGRTVHSLLMAMRHFNPTFHFIAPEELKMPEEYKIYCKEHHIKYKEYTDFNEETIADADILYMTRVQRERFTDLMEYERVKDVYILRNKMLEHTRPNLRILHPLPRVNEIAYDVDENPKAYYFQQAQNGLYARQAILCDVLGITLNDVIEDAKK